MPRQPRVYLPGCAQHIIQRGNNRDACFNEDGDYRAYLSQLKDAAENHNVAVHAYVLMSNHVHLLATPEDDRGIGRTMQSLGRRYVQCFNKRYQRSGTLWEGRYKSTLVDAETYLLTVYRYIELNPVRAAMVEHPAEYPWSSYAYNAVGLQDEVVTPHESYQLLGASREQQQKVYRSLFNQTISNATLCEIRSATNKASLLGSDGFKRDFERRTERRATARPRGGDRRSERWRGGNQRL